MVGNHVTQTNGVIEEKCILELDVRRDCWWELYIVACGNCDHLGMTEEDRSPILFDNAVSLVVTLFLMNACYLMGGYCEILLGG